MLDLPNALLKQLASAPDGIPGPLRPADRDAQLPHLGDHRRAHACRIHYGYNGAGIGVAVIDSGHHDLARRPDQQDVEAVPYGNQRVAKFVDFVNGRTLPYDDNGHGTHVSGIIAGNGS